MHISWGIKITALYCSFVIMMVTLVIASSRSKVELVSDNYYEQEVVFEQRLRAARAGAALHQATVSAEGDRIAIQLPGQYAGDPVAVTAGFYAVAHSAADRSFELETANGALTVPRSGLAREQYRVQLSWKVAGQTYYQSVPLNLVD